MKDILVYNDNGSIFGIGKIELGFFENDPEEETYKITLENGEIYYALAQNYSKYEVEDIPENWKSCIYSPIEGFIEIKTETEYKEEGEQKILELEREIEKVKNEYGI